MLNLLIDKVKQITKMLGSSINQKLGAVKNNSTIKKIREYLIKLKAKIKQIISKSLPNQSLDKDYYKPIKDNSAFNSNYMKYKSKGDKDKRLSPKKYLDMIRPYLHNMIIDHKKLGEWKIQLAMSINFISSKDSNETHNMHTKSDNIEIMMGCKTNNIIKKLCKSLLQRYQERLEESQKRSDFVFDSVNLLYHQRHKISPKRTGSSYIESPEWLKNKKATINPKNSDNNCFQYAITIALNHQSIKKDPQRISKIKPFID